MSQIMRAVVMIAIALSGQMASAWTPDLVRGCRAIAEASKNTSKDDAIHAAYCLGVLDGILTTVSKQRTGVPLPDPCFNQALVHPGKLAEQVVRVLTAQPRLLEVAKSSANDRGGMAAYVALAIENKCAPGEKP